MKPSFDPTPRATLLISRVSTSVGDTVQWDITSLVQDWQTGTLTNYGLVIREVVGGEWRNVWFGSRENDLYPNPLDFPPPDLRSYPGPSLVLEFPILVEIDVKPGSDPNCVNINGNGIVPVAILGSEEFDVTMIDTSTLRFAGLEVRIRGKKGQLCHLQDVSGDFSSAEGEPDGFLDLVCQFEDDPDQWVTGDGTVELTGTLLPEYGEDSIVGTDSICTKP